MQGAPEIDRVILAGSVPGLGTRTVGEAPVEAGPARRRAIRDASAAGVWTGPGLHACVLLPIRLPTSAAGQELGR